MRSINGKHLLRVCEDIYVLFMIWTLWAAGVLIVGYLVAIPFFESLRAPAQSALAIVTNPAQIFMFVLGIITGVYIIQYYIRQGVTRRTFLYGTVAGGVAVAASIQLIGVLLTGITILVETITPYQAGRELIPYLDMSFGYLITIGISILILTAHFFMGWVIGFAFYRFRGYGGFPAILAGLLVMGALSIIWGHGGVVSFRGDPFDLITAELSLTSAVLVTALVLAGQLAGLYAMVRNSPITVQ